MSGRERSPAPSWTVFYQDGPSGNLTVKIDFIHPSGKLKLSFDLIH